MNTTLLVGGPLVLVLITTFLIWSGVITFGEVPDPMQENAQTSFSESAGLDLSVEDQSIEYRNGLEKETRTRQPGLTKYANIHINTSKLKDLIFWNWTVEGTDKTIQVESEAKTQAQMQGGVEMKQIEPPVLVIPAR